MIKEFKAQKIVVQKEIYKYYEEKNTQKVNKIN